MNKETPKLLKDFLIYLTTITGKSKKTRQEYYYDLTMFLQFLWCVREDVDIHEMKKVSIGSLDIDFIRDISLEDLYLFLEFCEVQRKNSTYARARKVASIKSFFKYLKGKRRLLDYNPAEELESPKIGKRTPVYLNVQEAELFLDGIKQGTHFYRDTCILTFFLNLALRVSELSDLNLNSIQGNNLKIIGKGNKERVIPLNHACIEALESYKEQERNLIKNVKEEEALFLSQKGTRLNTRSIQRLVKSVNERSGLEKEKLTPHKLRHTAATLLYREKHDIRSLQYILGHESVSTTQVYTHVDSVQLQNLIAVNPLNKQKKVD